MMSRKRSVFLSSAAIIAPLILAPTTATAAFDPGIVINASAQLDTSAPTSGSPSQSATLSLTSGGAPVTPTTYDGTTVSGNNPLQGTLTDIGDSIGISLSADGAEGDESLFFGEFLLDLTNTTGTDYKVFLGFTTTNSVVLPGGVVGDDAFGINEFYMEDEDTGEELNFSYRELDLFNDVDDASASVPSNYIVVVEDGQTVFLYGLN
ncbi:MAG: hypothetical protein KJO38_07200, partial [Gammaproteobacteria bacterium]|nr:hypothetical protein [Gammaproteobacteria bacterium]